MYWVMLDVLLVRLRVFYNVCLYLMEYLFWMDRWMLRFIFEYGLLMLEKFEVLGDVEDRVEILIEENGIL